MLTVLIIIAIAAFATAIVSAMGKCPIWVSVMLICVFMLLQALPLK